MVSEKQKTIKTPITVKGSGLHTGKEVTLTFKPAPENHGIKFQRIDIEGSPIVPADIDFVIETERGTSLEKDNVKITTAEHPLAAIVGLGIDNILIELNATETPIMDGSSQPFLDALLESGIVEQEAEKEYFQITENIIYTDEDNKIEIMALPADNYKLTVMIDYNSPILGRQHATMHDISQFKEDFAKCRTFVFLHELEYLIKNNLIKGGDLSNAIVIVDRLINDAELENLGKLFNKPNVVIKKEGVLNVDLHYPNEPARHKLLDLIGDLALSGVNIKGRIVATRPGHHANVQFAKLIKEQVKKEKLLKKKNIPQVDPNAVPLYDILAIQKRIPHRPPFLLVDKVMELGENHVIGVKNVTMNEPFFVGHFPSEPVMPGVLIIEALAQCGGIFVLESVPDPENYLTYFLRIDNARFKQKVFPGDTLIFRNTLTAPIRRGICEMKGEAYVGDKLVVEADLMAQIVKVKNN